jgi:hypothetical protein
MKFKIIKFLLLTTFYFLASCSKESDLIPTRTIELQNNAYHKIEAMSEGIRVISRGKSSSIRPRELSNKHRSYSSDLFFEDETEESFTSTGVSYRINSKSSYLNICTKNIKNDITLEASDSIVNIQFDLNTDVNLDLEVNHGMIITNHLPNKKSKIYTKKYNYKSKDSDITIRIKLITGTISLSPAFREYVYFDFHDKVDVTIKGNNVTVIAGNNTFTHTIDNGVIEIDNSNHEVKLHLNDLSSDLYIKNSNKSITAYMSENINSFISMSTSNSDILIDKRIKIRNIKKDSYTGRYGKIGTGGNYLYLQTSNDKIDIKYLD